MVPAASADDGIRQIASPSFTRRWTQPLREVARTVARGAVKRPGPRDIARLRVRFSRVLDLTDPTTLAGLGLDSAALTADDVTTARELGEAANYLGYEAILAPSATGSGQILAVLVMNRAASSELSVLDAAGGTD